MNVEGHLILRLENMSDKELDKVEAGLREYLEQNPIEEPDDDEALWNSIEDRNQRDTVKGKIAELDDISARRAEQQEIRNARRAMLPVLKLYADRVALANKVRARKATNIECVEDLINAANVYRSNHDPNRESDAQFDQWARQQRVSVLASLIESKCREKDEQTHDAD